MFGDDQVLFVVSVTYCQRQCLEATNNQHPTWYVNGCSKTLKSVGSSFWRDYSHFRVASAFFLPSKYDWPGAFKYSRIRPRVVSDMRPSKRTTHIS